MKRIVIFILLAIICLPQTSLAAKRVALVIGNAGYASSPLGNPVHDASDMGTKLARLGFDVTLLKDASARDMSSSIRDFRKKLSAADIRLFYFAGHGVQVGGANYLLPIGVDIQYEDEVRHEAIAADRVLDTMAAAGQGVNVVILDACRNNPFVRSFRSSDRGLAPMSAPSGSMIVYATAPGSVAEDGQGRNGVFTDNLLRNLDKPNLTLEQVFKRTGKGVMMQTSGRQLPWTHSSLYDDVYLAGNAPVQQPVTSPQASTPQPAAPQPALQTASIQPSPAPSQTIPQSHVRSGTPKEILRRGVLRVGLEAGYMPFEMTNKHGKYVGFDIDLAADMAQAMGVRVEFVNTAWDGIIPALIIKKFDILLSGMVITDERLKQVDFIHYFTEGQTAIVGQKDANRISTIKDLNNSGITVATKLGTISEQVVKRYLPNAACISFDTDKQAFKAVQAGRATAYVYNLTAASIHFNMVGKKAGMKFLDTPFYEEEFGIAIRQGEPELQSWLETYMDRIRQDGTYDTLYAKWFRSADWMSSLN